MSEKIDRELMLLKGFSFDGDTGRTLDDLYSAVMGTGCTKDDPFAVPTRLEGHDRPAVLNSYLDPEDKRVHIIWKSDRSGLSCVVDVVLDAPPLAKERHSHESCEICSIDMMKETLQAESGSE